MTTTTTPRVAGEQGIAIVLALFLITAMSVIGASLMFLAQTETYSSMNYRMMSQARYGAESGIQVAVNHLLNTYVPPGQNVADPLAAYDMTVSPVTTIANGKSVVLSADPTVANYPVAAVQTAYLAATQGSLPAGNTTVAYAPAATLIGMQQINVFGGGVQTIQTWSITSSGTIATSRTAVVQVTATLETQKTAVTAYGAFATGATCGALQFSGSSTIDSFDSTLTPGVAPAIANSGGNVGTNGNLGESGNATVDGSLSSPRVGVGNCSNGNVDALSSSGNAKLCPNPAIACNGIQPGGVVNLPQAVTLPTPTPPATSNTTVNPVLPLYLNGTTLGNVSVGGSNTLTLGAVGVTSVINMNSLTMSGNSHLVILGTVILNIGGTGIAAGQTALDLSGNDVSNPGYHPDNFQIEYGGTGNVNITGNSDITATVYAPNAAVTLSGNGSLYGSVVGHTFIDSGNGHIHFDRHLSSSGFSVGSPMMSAFSWKKY